MDVFDLSAKISLNSSEYTNGLLDASDKTSSFGSKLSTGLVNAAKIGAAAIGAATTALIAFGKSSVDTGKEFDSSMSQVAATMGYSLDDINNNINGAADTMNTLRNFAQEMGSTTAYSATQAADALNYMALAGYDAETSMNMLPKVLNLAAAGDIELARASDMVTDAQTALGLSLDDTSVMVDQMAVTASKSNTSVEQLGDAFLTIGANARNLAGGTNELSTMLGVLADNGIKGSEAGTHLRNIMLAMNPTTDKAAVAWKQLGVSAYDAQGNLRPLQDTFGDLNTAMQGMTDQEKSNILTKMFNKTDLASINALLGTEVSRFDELSTAIDNSAGAAENMAKVQLDNLEGDITLFKSALEGAQIAVSDLLTPALRDFVQMGSSGISEITEKLREGDFEGAFATLGESLGEFAVKISDMAPNVVDAAISLLEAFGKGIVDNLDKIIESSIKIIETIGKALIEHIPDLVKVALDIIVQLAKYLTESLPNLIPAAIDMLLEIIDTLLDNIDMLVDTAIDLIVALAEGLIKALPKLIAKVPEIIIKLCEAISRNLPKILEAGVKIIIELATGIIKALPDLIRKIPEVIGAIVNTLSDAYEKFKDAGKNIVKGIWQGIKDNWKELISSVMDMAGDLIEGVKNVFGIASPSKVFKQIGEYCVDGLELGSDNMFSEEGLNATIKANVDEVSTVDDKHDIIKLLEEYLPTFATKDSFNNMGLSVNNREFARLVNGVI